ncbi:MAG TPA: LysR family transcriptional regulator [Solirubrobacteraceae bacterium]|nr:LysR family transcriptional regulator [Solirubrobacteraceae bacterium]
MLDLKLLQSFREVAVRRSFSAAAEALSFTQPAVSQHIARLEKALDAPLLVREPRGVTLTPAGEALLRHAEEILGGVRRAEAAVRELAGAERPIVRLGAFQSAAAALVADAFREVRAEHPGVDLQARAIEPDPGIAMVATGALDVTMVIESLFDQAVLPPGVELRHIFDYLMLVVLPDGHPLAHRPSIPLEEMSEDPWLLGDVAGTCPDTNIVLRACQEAGFTPRLEYSSEDYNAVQGMVASGMGVALIPSMVTVMMRPDVVVRPIRGQAPMRRIHAAVRTGEDNPVVESLVEALRAAARPLGTVGMRAAQAA